MISHDSKNSSLHAKTNVSTLALLAYKLDTNHQSRQRDDIEINPKKLKKYGALYHSYLVY